MTSRLTAAAFSIATLCLASAAQAQTCAKDSDCTSGMVCHAQTSTECSGGTAIACPANTFCDAGTPTKPTCTETTTYSCVYRWQLPCNADTDCGDGFVCQPMTQGICSSSGGTATPGSTGSGTTSSGISSGAGGGSGSVPPVAVDAGAATCTTTTSFPGTCQPKNSTCTTDSDCPAAWTCNDVVVVPVTGGAPIAIAIDGGAVVQPADTATATSTSTGTSLKTCQSPYGSSTPISNGGRGDIGYQAADGGTTTKGSTTSPVTSGSSTNTSTQTTTQTAAKTGGGGCSMAGNGSASAAWFALLGLVALAARRRR